MSVVLGNITAKAILSDEKLDRIKRIVHMLNKYSEMDERYKGMRLVHQSIFDELMYEVTQR